MGYYIDLIFDEPDITHEEVMKRFKKQGVKVFEEYYQDEDLPESHKKYYETHIPMQYGKPGMHRPHLEVFKNEAKSPKGSWADIRLSWAEDPNEFIENLKEIIALADSVGGKVYDGQIEEFLTVDNMNKALACFFGNASLVEWCFGKTN